MVSPAELRSAAKRQAIIDAARSVFLAGGFAGASVDEVAALASTSKRTVYGLFGDKKGLFTAVITEDIEAAEHRSHDSVEALAASQDLATDLRAFARRHVVNVIQPHLMRLRRLVIGEAERFPDLASTWYANGPGRGHTTLARVFTTLAGRGLLRADDPALAAQHFNWLILSIPLNQAMFHTDDHLTPATLEHYADEGTRVFLAAYGVSRPSRPAGTLGAGDRSQ
ncbi:TetR/AcrR family transcriptional regulator [Nonomuraea sp. NPDC050547]|uniref:TetR/AcrR family transcriptional regulator n=1 Tax=Nonomuraea sp. NPDC050547 TaxID=3364368 RepID=UPI003789F89F